MGKNNETGGADDNVENKMEDLNYILKGYEEEFGGSDESDHDDRSYRLDFDSGQETEELDSGASDIDDASDAEFVNNRKNYKTVKEGMKEWDYSESDFDSDELRSIGSSSEDEKNKIGYVGPPVIAKKRRRHII